MSDSPIGGSDAMADAASAFEATLDAETPSRSKRAKEPEREERTPIDELFPRRRMDRSEAEGGANDEPDLVKRARAQARADAEPSPRDPTEGNEEDEDEDDAGYEDDDDKDQGEEEDPDQTGMPIDLSQVVEVTVDGQPVEVSLNEALRGYIRQETFHKRLGELQGGVQALQGQRTELAQVQQQFVERVKLVEDYIAAFMPQEPDWDQLYAQNPAFAAQQDRKWRSFQTQVQNMLAQREATQQELDATKARNLHNFVAANRTHLAQAHPEWTNEKSWKRDHDSMRRTARAAGYTDPEIDQLYDARGVEVLLKAAKWDRLMASKPKPAKQGFGDPLKRNGATPKRGNATRSFDRAEKRLSRTGSIQAAADVFENILDRESSNGKGR